MKSQLAVEIAKNVLVVFVLTMVAVLSRLLPHAPNVTALVGASLVAGMFLRPQLAFVVAILSMLASDMILGFHTTMFFVYGALILITALGCSFRGQKLLGKVGLSLTGSLLFYMMTNFGVWLTGDLYPSTASGLMQSYVMGIPFLTNQMIGDLCFVLGLSFFVELVFRSESSSAIALKKSKS